MKISVIIPAYNEEKNIISTLEEVVGYLKNKFANDWEVIVVDDGSSDNTYGLVREWIEKRGLRDSGINGLMDLRIKELKDYGNVRLLKNEKNMGKGASVRRGMLEAKGDIRFFMDADNSTNIRELDKALPLLNEGVDIVISSRKLKDSLITRKQPFLRQFMSRVHHWIVNLLLGTRVSDYNCGFKVFKADVAEKLFSLQRINRWVFDAEILFIGKRKGYIVKEIPVTWEHKSTSKVRPLYDMISSLRGIFEIKINDFQGKYN
jgi:dolichyl-phosphate beta-glucosyltransferase